ncbi:hypothetical protein Tco_0255416 [Tanacetum coccineum]
MKKKRKKKKTKEDNTENDKNKKEEGGKDLKPKKATWSISWKWRKTQQGMHLGFYAAHGCDLMAKDGPCGGHPREETRTTRSVTSLTMPRYIGYSMHDITYECDIRNTIST